MDLDIVARKNFINLETHRQSLALKLQQTQQQLQLQQQQQQLQQLQQQHLKKLLQIQNLQNFHKIETEDKNGNHLPQSKSEHENESITTTTTATTTSNQSIEEIKTPIQKFYQNSSIFLTGGTGFMGKGLIEKLLRTCSGLECIYVLVRPKKGKDVHTRMDELFEDPVSKQTISFIKYPFKIFHF
jgi:FlaA1/EpsC-like NDP-sugar epimerase